MQCGEPALDTVDLLWRNHAPRPARRGRRPKRTTDHVVAAAIAVADRRGLSFTLRDVAEESSTPVMSLYSYVDGREQLLELMVDQCRLYMAHTELSGGWAERLTTVASDNMQLFADHPWLAEVEPERTILGPGTLTKYERELVAVQALPIPDAERDAALTLVLDFVRSSARARAHARREREQETPEQWWGREGAKLERLGVADRFPFGVADRNRVRPGPERGQRRRRGVCVRVARHLRRAGITPVRRARDEFPRTLRSVSVRRWQAFSTGPSPTAQCPAPSQR